MGPNLAGIWLLHLGVLAILDAKMFRIAAVDGQRKTGTLVWGIIMLSVAGIAALEGLYSLFGSFRAFEYVGEAPFPILSGFFANLSQIGVCVFMILGGINRIRMRSPGFGVPKVIFGACAGFFAILLFVSGLIYYF
jgi:hypothetical protein